MTEITEVNDVTEATQKYILLHGRHWVSKALYESVQQQVQAAIPHLERDRHYTLRQICGQEYWALLSKGEPIAVGIAVSYMVACGTLPLIRAGTNQENARLYVLS